MRGRAYAQNTSQRSARAPESRQATDFADQTGHAHAHNICEGNPLCRLSSARPFESIENGSAAVLRLLPEARTTNRAANSRNYVGGLKVLLRISEQQIRNAFRP